MAALLAALPPAPPSWVLLELTLAAVWQWSPGLATPEASLPGSCRAARTPLVRAVWLLLQAQEVRHLQAVASDILSPSWPAQEPGLCVAAAPWLRCLCSPERQPPASGRAPPLQQALPSLRVS